MNGPRRALVVGAGFAGLSAAHRLVRAGFEVIVCEASGRPGPLASVRVGTREVLTECAIVPAIAPELHGLVRELGLSASVCTTPLGLWPAPAAAPLDGLRRRRLRRLLAWFADLLDPSSPGRAARLDDRSVADFARVYLGRRWLEQRLASVLEPCFGLPVEETSRLLPMLLMDAHGDLPLAQVEGLASLARALVAPIKELRLGTRVVSIGRAGRHVTLASGERIETDCVLLSIPPHELRLLRADASPREKLYLEQAGAFERLRCFVQLETGWASDERRRLFALRTDLLAGALEWPGASDVLCLTARPERAAALAREPDAEVARLLVAPLATRPFGLAVRSETATLVRDAMSAARPGHYRLAARVERLSSRTIVIGERASIGPHLEASLHAGRRAANELLSR